MTPGIAPFADPTEGEGDADAVGDATGVDEAAERFWPMPGEWRLLAAGLPPDVSATTTPHVARPTAAVSAAMAAIRRGPTATYLSTTR